MNTNNSVIAKAILGESNKLVEFNPNREFYQITGIKQKRFGQIYRGEKSPEIEEIESISSFLNIPKEKFGLISN